MARKKSTGAAAVPKTSIPAVMELQKVEQVAARIMGKVKLDDDERIWVGRDDENPTDDREHILYRWEPKGEAPHEWSAIAQIPDGYDAYHVDGLGDYSHLADGWWIGPQEVIDKVHRLHEAVDTAKLALCDVLESRKRPGIKFI